MKAVPTIARALAVVLALGAAGCSDAGGDLLSPPTRTHRLLAYSTESLATGLNLSTGSFVSWNVTVPSSGYITIAFDARINYSGTAGNTNVLDVWVNGTPVTAAQLVNKGSTYTYVNRGGTEYYHDQRGFDLGQPTPYWGLFWSPDFTANNTSSNYYYVQGGNAYTYVLNISGMVNYGQANTITFVNEGGWFQTATGMAPTIALRNVVARAQ